MLRMFIVAVCLIASFGIARADDYQKVLIDALMMTATTDRDAADHSIVGRKFDVTAILTVYPPKMDAKISWPSQWRWSRYGGAITLSALSDSDREMVFDQCSPLPCKARMLLTVLPPKGPAGFRLPNFQLDGFKD